MHKRKVVVSTAFRFALYPLMYGFLHTKKLALCIAATVILAVIFSFSNGPESNAYKQLYLSGLHELLDQEKNLASLARELQSGSPHAQHAFDSALQQVRFKMKGMDFWLRYLDPVLHKKINGPLPVEWENEVFEKFEKPYKRDGAGLTLAYLLAEEPDFDPHQLQRLLDEAVLTTPVYEHDTITTHLDTYHHFFLCNRLHLLNLATLYTSGFDCPNGDYVISELRQMMKDVKHIYETYNRSFPQQPLPVAYLERYEAALGFASAQPDDYTLFNHYRFIRDYVNPLFALNQQLLVQYQVVSKSFVNYSLNKHTTTIFSKSLYHAQNPKGIFLRVDDKETLDEIAAVGKLLFYDPILSANNERSCASCHKPEQFFTDTTQPASERFDHRGFLPRNTPTLLNAQFNHLLMLDGKHISLQTQARDVMTNADEMGSSEAELLQKVLSCKTYKQTFSRLLKLTPQEKEITMDHLASAITFYYGQFSNYQAPFEDAMNQKAELPAEAEAGFNVFMGKAQCGTCHFAPQFNGIKPPYVSSEFEVLGVPANTTFDALSKDSGRHGINPASETLHAFRTGSLRNIARTAPYMHNGTFNTLAEVIDFYNNGGGAGRGLTVSNQTLSSDSLQLTSTEKQQLIAFMQTLTEPVVFEKAPEQLPASSIKKLNTRKPGGTY